MSGSDACMSPSRPRSSQGAAAHRSRRFRPCPGLPERGGACVSAEARRLRHRLMRPPVGTSPCSSPDGEARVPGGRASWAAVARRRGCRPFPDAPCGAPWGRLDRGALAPSARSAGPAGRSTERPTAPASAGCSTKRHREIRSWGRRPSAKLAPHGPGGPSLGFRALRRVRPQAATCAGVASPDYAASSGFLDLLTLSSACDPSGLVSCR